MDSSSSFKEESISVDSISREQLSGAARWAKFVAILGFFAIAYVVLARIVIVFTVSHFNNLPVTGYSRRPMVTGRPVYMDIFNIIFSAAYFFPCLSLYRFAEKMELALRERDQQLINESFLNLKNMFRFAGMITVIGVFFYIILILVKISGVIST